MQNSDELGNMISRANNGSAEAQFQLGLMHYDGKGIIQDNEEAQNYFVKAAQQGHAGAKKRFEDAANNGSAEAQYFLGALYYQGLGVPQSKMHAYMWWSIASANGNTNSKNALGNLQMTPEGVERAQEKAADRVEKNLNLIKQEAN